VPFRLRPFRLPLTTFYRNSHRKSTSFCACDQKNILFCFQYVTACLLHPFSLSLSLSLAMLPFPQPHPSSHAMPQPCQPGAFRARQQVYQACSARLPASASSLPAMPTCKLGCAAEQSGKRKSRLFRPGCLHAQSAWHASC